MRVNNHFARNRKVCVCIVYRNCIVLRFNNGDNFFYEGNYFRYAYVCGCVHGDFYNFFRCRHTKLYAEHACRKRFAFPCVPKRNIAKFYLYFADNRFQYAKQFVAVYNDTYAVFRKTKVLQKLVVVRFQQRVHERCRIDCNFARRLRYESCNQTANLVQRALYLQALARYVYRFVFVYYAYGNFSAVYAYAKLCAYRKPALRVNNHFARNCKVCVCIVYRNCIVFTRDNRQDILHERRNVYRVFRV